MCTSERTKEGQYQTQLYCTVAAFLFLAMAADVVTSAADVISLLLPILHPLLQDSKIIFPTKHK